MIIQRDLMGGTMEVRSVQPTACLTEFLMAQPETSAEPPPKPFSRSAKEEIVRCALPALVERYCAMRQAYSADFLAGIVATPPPVLHALQTIIGCSSIYYQAYRDDREALIIKCASQGYQTLYGRPPTEQLQRLFFDTVVALPPSPTLPKDGLGKVGEAILAAITLAANSVNPNPQVLGKLLKHATIRARQLEQAKSTATSLRQFRTYLNRWMNKNHGEDWDGNFPSILDEFPTLLALG